MVKTSCMLATSVLNFDNVMSVLVQRHVCAKMAAGSGTFESPNDVQSAKSYTRNLTKAKGNIARFIGDIRHDIQLPFRYLLPLFARWQHEPLVDTGGVFGAPYFWEGYRRKSAMIPFERAMVVSYWLFPLRSDHCAISNHSAVICHPTLKSTGVGLQVTLGQTFGRKGLTDVN